MGKKYKNPNGYGSVIYLGKGRRNAFVVRKTIGWDENGNQIYKVIGYYETRQDADYALADYNRNPYDVNARRITMSELWDLWLEKKSAKLGESNLVSLKSAYKHAASLHKMKYAEIKIYHMQDIIDRRGRGYSTQAAIKNMFNKLDIAI